jgi:hypothetical protein
MEKTKLKLFEFVSLQNELIGAKNPSTGETLTEGLLKQKLSITTKYWLGRLGDKVAKEAEAINKLRDELVMKYGEADENGNVEVKIALQDELTVDEQGNKVFKVNPKFLDFQNEYNTLLEEEKEIEHKIFDLNELSEVKTEEHYPVFLKLVKVEE